MLDINILAAASVFRDRTPWRLVEPGLRGEYELVLSDEMLTTLGYVLNRKYFAQRLSEEERVRVLVDVRTGTHREPPDPAVRGVRIVTAARFLEVLEAES